MMKSEKAVSEKGCLLIDNFANAVTKLAIERGLMGSDRCRQEYNTTRNALANYVSGLEAEVESIPRWNLVSEQPPELKKDVLGFIENTVLSGEFVYGYDGKVYFAADVSNSLIAVTHWMPMPVGPKEGKA